MMDTITTSSTAVVALHGKGVAKGIAIGHAVIMGAALLEVKHHLIAPEDIDNECARLDHALQAVAEDLEYIKNNLPEDAPMELAPVLTVHSMLLADPMLASEIKEIIRTRRYNAEWALSTQGQILADQFGQMDDEYLRERASDVTQVIERVLSFLAGVKSFDLQNLPDHDEDDLPFIVVAHDISPADMLNLRAKHFAAFITDAGGPTSHTAIVARSMHVPAVVGMKNVRSLVRDREVLIVDGDAGLVIVNPSPLILAQYRQKQRQQETEREFLLLQKDEPAVTVDGVFIELEGNIELPEEAAEVLAMGATGIGLYRSEFLFMNRDSLPSEEEQYKAYSSVLKTMGEKAVTIRTLDIGSDKTLHDDATVAVNPALGLRAVRYCLAHPEMFLTQLRALLRASIHGRLRILIPMISHMHEVQEVKRYLTQAQNELMAEGYEISDKIELGAMVEIPAIAIAIEPFLKELDFVSIGTNDLIQYTLAVDRVDDEVVGLYDSVHPAVLRLIHNTIQAGDRAGKPVCVCGEMAGDTQYTKLLLGLGLKSFSMHPAHVPEVKQIVRQSHTNVLRTRVANTLNYGVAIDLDAVNAA
ncbi:phosphoenolpyruvate--protein phosphotransferase [Pelistega europaea]|uniref:Phosphoenolpyruvate-protein phosphotransferase n=1 Tax=Pelistega europaea TaxID=106147 RepID=A0A7Y4LAD6_9BURK|nr:phosphoenolpyruvate--protein phosphotransferase [Pelistega europaea]NOL49877.1 phosphoenolpyruvate--protein phosphotransferase [Pelistega europaea]